MCTTVDNKTGNCIVNKRVRTFVRSCVFVLTLCFVKAEVIVLNYE